MFHPKFIKAAIVEDLRECKAIDALGSNACLQLPEHLG